MSTLPPLPPDMQAKVEQNYTGALDMLAVAVESASTDPKRDRSNDADYHNTTVAMLMQWDDHTKDEGRGILTMCAAAILELNRIGWTRNDGDPREGRVPPKPPQRRALAGWFWPFAVGALATAAATTVLELLT